MYDEKRFLTAREILEKDFKIDARGYRPQEVDQFLDLIIKDYVDFDRLKSSGVDFVMLRLGQRGYASGEMSLDENFLDNYARAREAGSDYIVVGRPITAAERPIDAYVRCKEEFLQG